MRKPIKFFLFSGILFGFSLNASSQELFVNTEPASNMASHSLGFRLNQEFQFGNQKDAIRFNPELMIGVDSRFMFHINGYFSNIYQDKINWEGVSFYGKYKLISWDNPQTHFRISGYARYSTSRDPNLYSEINLQGDNSGWLGGVVLTQLIHKLALSSNLDLDHSLQNGDNQLAYTLSSGYLLLPRFYTSYKQTNLNFYLEVLGKSSLNGLGSYLDLAPSIQFIFHSQMRMDLGYDTEVAGHLNRFSKNGLLVRFEYNFFNAF